MTPSALLQHKERYDEKEDQNSLTMYSILELPLSAEKVVLLHGEEIQFVRVPIWGDTINYTYVYIKSLRLSIQCKLTGSCRHQYIPNNWLFIQAVRDHLDF